MRFDLVSGNNFLQRLGLVEPNIGPWPTQDTRSFTAHRLSLTGWTPLLEQLREYDGDPPPDRGQTYEWPPDL